MATLLDCAAAGALREAPAPTVSVKARWSDAWTAVDYLYCDRCTWAASPAGATAQLRWRYGEGQRAGEAFPGVVALRDLLPEYLRIAAPTTAGGTAYWYGVLTDESRALYGETPAGAPAGEQTFTARGLEILLERITVRASWYRDAAGNAIRVNRALDPNATTDGPRDAARPARGNLATALGTPLFAGDPSAATLWTGQDLCAYLAERYFPSGWRLDVGPLSLLDWYTPTLRGVHGRSVRALLDELLPADRLLGWYVSVDLVGGAETPTVHVFSRADADVLVTTAAGVGVLPANPTQVTLDFETDCGTAEARLSKTIAHQYDRVRLRGARRGAVCTLSTLDGTLEADWSAAEQTSYNAGASGAVDYAGLDADEKCRRNDLARQSESLARVYAWWRIPSDWDGEAGDGIGGTAAPTLPTLQDDGTDAPAPAVQEALWLPGLRLERMLPLLSEHDYSGTKIEDGTVVDNTPAGAIAQPRAAFALLALESDGSGTQRWCYCDRLSASANNELAGGEEAGRQWDAQLGLQEFAAGVIVRCHGPQHLLAVTDFAGAAPSDAEPDLDWRTGLIATVYFQGDNFCEGVWPQNVVLGGDVVRELVVDVGEQFRLDYCAPNTVLDVVDGALVRSTSGGYLQDDRTTLTSWAQVLYVWHTTERNVLSLRLRQIFADAAVGQLALDLGSGEVIRTPITQVSCDFLRGETTITTEAAYLRPFV